MKNALLNLLQKWVWLMARLTVRRFKPHVIAVTGSVGKTSAKEALYAALAGYKRIRKTSANFNNELGVPLTIVGDWDRVSKPAAWFWIKVLFYAKLNLLFGSKKKFPEILILEYGADKPGDIGVLVDLARPHTAVLTGIGAVPVHVENYEGGIEAVVKEKGKLIVGLAGTDWAILNADDPHIQRLASKTKAKVVRYGIGADARIRIRYISHAREDGQIAGLSFKLEKEGTMVPITIRGAFSIAHAYAVSAAACVAERFGINLVEVAEGINRLYRPVQGRSTILEGVKKTQIIDESYNSSPMALETALRTLAHIEGRRKIAVLGDMLELGEYTIRAHEAMGELVPECADMLITVGPRAKFIAHRALKSMKEEKVLSFDTAFEAGRKLQEIMREGDLILIKGSRGVKLDRIVEEIKKE